MREWAAGPGGLGGAEAPGEVGQPADRFLAAHRALAGFDHHPWWDVAAAVDVVPEVGPEWRRLEELVAAALASLGRPAPGPG